MIKWKREDFKHESYSDLLDFMVRHPSDAELALSEIGDRASAAAREDAKRQVEQIIAMAGWTKEDLARLAKNIDDPLCAAAGREVARRRRDGKW